MVPERLKDWTLAQITGLLDQGVLEDERFDWKERLWDRRNSDELLRVRKSCSAFANSRGGYLVYGVSDDRTASTRARLVGLEADSDFNEYFGKAPAGCSPSVPWTPIPAPIRLSDDRCIWVVEIPRSSAAPHAAKVEGGTFTFFKRTNQGNEPMTYRELRGAFADRLRLESSLNLLRLEVEGIKAEADLIAKDYYGVHGAGEIGLELLERAFADVYQLFPDYLLRDMAELRRHARRLNNRQRRVSLVQASGGDPDVAVGEAKGDAHRLRGDCEQLLRNFDREILTWLQG